MLTILGVVCLGSFLIAAFTWSSQVTASKGPQEVSLASPSNNEWDDASFFQANVAYDITTTATYNFHSGTQITYSLSVIATANQGTIELSDFTIIISGVTVTLTETSAGTWSSSQITISSDNPSDEINVRIVPTNNALDLGQVHFAISAQSSA
ncbi:MAG: hypothetical protein SA339_10605 [Methanomassiliicoccus sp.]|nr:hypothetical protein [Methanomassiliicoccus sp.]